MGLQEMFGLCDQRALDALAFDIRWQHALGFGAGDDAYLSRRSYVEFRSRLVRDDPEMALLRKVFDRVGATAIDSLGISVKEQRIDSTHIMSNIATRGRGALFASTLVLFLRELDRQWPQKWALLSDEVHAWYDGRESSSGWFAGTEAEAKKRERLVRLGGWLAEVKLSFANDEDVAACEPYRLVARLVSEHLDLVGAAQPNATPTSGTDAPGEGSAEGTERGVVASGSSAPDATATATATAALDASAGATAAALVNPRPTKNPGHPHGRSRVPVRAGGSRVGRLCWPARDPGQVGGDWQDLETFGGFGGRRGRCHRRARLGGVVTRREAGGRPGFGRPPGGPAG